MPANNQRLIITSSAEQTRNSEGNRILGVEIQLKCHNNQIQ